MKLKSLRMKNFFSHKDTLIDFDTIDQIAMIVGSIEGDLRRSNGSGKSTFIEAILFALFETTRFTENKNATLDDMIRWNSDGKMSVEFQFELNLNLYKIERTRDSKKQKSTVVFEVLVDSKWKSLKEANKSTTNKEIIKIIGIDYDTFCASICFQQKEVDKFVSATETERKSIIKNILQLDKYDEYKKSAKTKCEIAETKIEALGHQLSAISINALDLDVKKIELANIEKRGSLYTIEKEAIESQIEKLRKSQVAFNEQFEKKNSLQRQIKDRKESLQRITSQTTLAISKQEDYKKIHLSKESDLTRLQLKYGEIKDAFSVEKNDIIKDGKAVDIKLKASEKQFDKVSEEYHKLKGESERLDRELEKIEKLHGSHCPTCYHEISEESKSSSTEFLKAHKTTLLIGLSEALLSFDNSKKEVELNKKQLEEVKERLQEYVKWAKEKLHLQDTLNIVKESISEALRIVDDQKLMIKENQSMIDQYTKELAELEDTISKMVMDTDKFDEINKKIQEKNTKLVDTNRLFTETQIQKGRVSADIIQYQENLERVKKYKEERDLLQKDRFYYEELTKMFGKEIPTLIIENACFELGEEANKILQHISGDSIEFVTQRQNKDSSMKEVFEIEITRPGVDKPILIDALSNGQKFRVVFAIRIALSRLLVRRRSSTSMEFLFYDECFSSLDEKGIDDVIDVFRYLKDEFKHQLIITHGTGLRDRFDNNIIHVDQDSQGVSKVVI